MTGFFKIIGGGVVVRAVVRVVEGNSVIGWTPSDCNYLTWSDFFLSGDGSV